MTDLNGVSLFNINVGTAGGSGIECRGRTSNVKRYRKMLTQYCQVKCAYFVGHVTIGSHTVSTYETNVYVTLGHQIRRHILSD